MTKYHVAAFVTFVVLHTSFVAAQEAPQSRQLAAIPTLQSQRNGALDLLAVCNGDLTMLQQQLAATQKELSELKEKEKSRATEKNESDK